MFYWKSFLSTKARLLCVYHFTDIMWPLLASLEINFAQAINIIFKSSRLLETTVFCPLRELNARAK